MHWKPRTFHSYYSRMLSLTERERSSFLLLSSSTRNTPRIHSHPTPPPVHHSDIHLCSTKRWQLRRWRCRRRVVFRKTIPWVSLLVYSTSFTRIRECRWLYFLPSLSLSLSLSLSTRYYLWSSIHLSLFPFTSAVYLLYQDVSHFWILCVCACVFL